MCSVLINVAFNSMVEAQASHLYSYNHGFRGFAAKLTEEQASDIASESISILCNYFYNEKTGN